MKIRIEREGFAAAVGWVLRCVGVRATLPALGGVMLDATGEKLRLSGTDLELAGETEAEARIEEAGRLLLPGRVLGEIARSLPQGTVAVEGDASSVKISCGSAEFTLRCLSVEDFPTLARPGEAPGGTIDGKTFVAAITQVTRAASSDEARPVLTGTLAEATTKSVVFVATDSYRLAVREVAWKGPEEEVKRVIPARALQEAARGAEEADEIAIALGESQAGFSAAGWKLTTRLIEGEFPNWRQLIPENLPNTLKVEREAFSQALRRVGILAQSGAPVRLDLSADGVRLAAGTQDLGEAAEHVPGQFEGEPLTVAFNPQYLLDGIQAVEGGEVVLSVRDALKPGLVRSAGGDDGFTYLVMPVRTS